MCLFGLWTTVTYITRSVFTLYSSYVRYFAVWRLHNGLPLHDSFVEWSIRTVHLLLTHSFCFFFANHSFVFPFFFSHTHLWGFGIKQNFVCIGNIFLFFLKNFFKEIIKKKNSSYEILNMLHNFIIIFLLLELWSALVW